MPRPCVTWLQLSITMRCIRWMTARAPSGAVPTPPVAATMQLRPLTMAAAAEGGGPPRTPPVKSIQNHRQQHNHRLAHPPPTGRLAASCRRAARTLRRRRLTPLPSLTAMIYALMTSWVAWTRQLKITLTPPLPRTQAHLAKYSFSGAPSPQAPSTTTRRPPRSWRAAVSMPSLAARTPSPRPTPLLPMWMMAHAPTTCWAA